MKNQSKTVFLILLLLFFHCNEDSKNKKLQKIGKLEGEVSIIAWQGYLERGEKDPNVDWISEFENSTGCKVKVKFAKTSDEMVALMMEGGYDLVTASGDASIRLIQKGKVQEINTDLIPSWKEIDNRFKDSPWHTIENIHYGVPYQWGANVLMYNTKVFPKPPKTWKVVFEEMKLPDGLSNKGRVQAFDGPIYLADAALYLMRNEKSLRIKNPYELTEKQFTASVELIKKQKTLIHRYWRDTSIQIEDFLSEKAVVSSSWPYQVNRLKQMGEPINSTIPIEGATGWADTTMLHIDSENPNCAYKWMEHSLNPKVQGDLSAWFGSVPVNLKACYNNQLLGDNGCKKNGLNDFSRIWFWRTPLQDCKSGIGICVPYNRWVTEMVSTINDR